MITPEIFSRVKKKLNKINFLEDYSFFIDGFILRNTSPQGAFVSINLDKKSKLKKFLKSNMPREMISLPKSYIDMYIRPDQNYIEIRNIRLKQGALEKKGYSKKLVNIAEEIAREEGIGNLCVFYCSNESFWNYLNFEKRNDSKYFVDEYWIKELKE